MENNNNKILEITQNIETAENNCGKLLDESEEIDIEIQKYYTQF